MKLNDKRVLSLFTKSKLPARPINFENGDLIFPFDVKTGFVNATEGGYVFDNRVEDYSRFEKIFTGYEAILAQWDNSTFTRANATKDNLIKTYQSGSAFLAKEDMSTSTNDFDDYDVNDEFVVERDVIEVKYNTDKVFTEADVLKLYVIPNKYGKTLFRVDKIKAHPLNDKDEIAYSTITFSSVNNILAETGLAINQFIQFSAPGEGYAFPKLIERIKAGFEPPIDFNQEIDLPTPNQGDVDEYVVGSFRNEGLCKVKYNFGSGK